MSPPAPTPHPARRRGRATALACALVLLSVSLTVTAPPAAGGPLPDPAVAADGNLLANPSFEVGDFAKHPVSWAVGPDGAQTATIQSTAANVRSGKASLKIVDPDDPTSISIRNAPVTGFAGVSYTAKAWVKNGSGTTARFYLEFWGVDNRIGVVDTQPSTSTSWRQVSLTATAPAGTVHVRVAVYGGVATAGTSYYDDVSLVAAGPAYTPAIGSARELFVDDHRVESATDVERVVHPAVKRGAPLIVADRPWESSVYIYGSVVTGSPGAAYKMWYTAYNTPLAVYFLCYATSTDGITWTKPNLGRIAYGGSTANNIVGEYGGTVAYNPNEAAGRQYRLLTYISSPPAATMGYYAYHSGDGIAWTRTSETPVLPYGDVSNVSYDAARGRYIATTKQRTLNIATTPGTNDRMAWVSTSTDFTTWTAPRLAVEGDARDDAAAVGRGGLEGQVYGMPVYPYESTYLAMPWMFDVTGYVSGAGDGPIVAQLASSRDLVRWSRPARDPILPLGRAGAWDDSMIFTSTTLQVGAGTVSVYYGGFNVDHGGGPNQTAKIGLASWRRDGFVSLTNAGDDAGTVTTRPVTFTGGALHLNAVVRPGGSVRVEVLPATGTAPVTGFGPSTAVTGDQLDATVSWSGASLSTLAGQQVRLRFHLDDADLYSYWIA